MQQPGQPSIEGEEGGWNKSEDREGWHEEGIERGEGEFATA